MSPLKGLDGSAYAFLGIRPASQASRPASTASFIAAAICTGSRAWAMPVLEITASQPSSIATAASEALPMPPSNAEKAVQRVLTIHMDSAKALTVCKLDLIDAEDKGRRHGIASLCRRLPPDVIS